MRNTWNTLTAWAYHVAFYIPNRRKGWSHSDLVACRRIAAKVG